MSTKDEIPQTPDASADEISTMVDRIRSLAAGMDSNSVEFTAYQSAANALEALLTLR